MNESSSCLNIEIQFPVIPLLNNKRIDLLFSALLDLTISMNLLTISVILFRLPIISPQKYKKLGIQILLSFKTVYYNTKTAGYPLNSLPLLGKKNPFNSI